MVILRKYKKAIGSMMTNIKGLSPAIIQHRIPKCRGETKERPAA